MSNIKSVDAQATATTTILNIVRYLGLAGFGLSLLIVMIGATQDGRVVLAAPLLLIGAGFWYASLGWFVDTLRVLVKIEANTRDQWTA